MMSSWWRDKSATHRFDLYTRVSLYGLSVLEVMFALIIAGASTRRLGVAGAVFVALAVVHAVTGILVLRGALAWSLGSAAWPRRVTAAHAAVTVAGVGAALVVFSAAEDVPPVGNGPASVATVMFAGYFVAAVTPRLTIRSCAASIVGIVAVTGALMVATGWDPSSYVSAAVANVALLAAAVGTYRVSVWMIAIVWEIERSRDAQAHLAVAEERLRIARDMHDVLGRNLSVISLKSELAAELARRGRSEGPEEMGEVHAIAQASLRELRDVVRGFRGADLAAELEGARAVLRAAGTSTRVIGDAGVLPAAVQETLAWVVREGTTNVLRHSEASTCTITVDPGRGAGSVVPVVSVVMENDGVRAAGDAAAETDTGETVGSGTGPAVDGGGGSGLTGLSERLSGVGGTLTVSRPSPGWFRLVVEVPVPAGATVEHRS